MGIYKNGRVEIIPNDQGPEMPGEGALLAEMFVNVYICIYNDNTMDG